LTDGNRTDTQTAMGVREEKQAKLTISIIIFHSPVKAEVPI
jgi:hypothetical protein